MSRATDQPPLNIGDTLDYQCGPSLDKPTYLHFEFPTITFVFKCPKCRSIDHTRYDRPRHCANCFRNGGNTVWMEKT